MTVSNTVIERIAKDLYGAWKTQVLLTALELGIFTAIAQGYTLVPDISKQLGLKQNGAERILDALVSLGYLTTVDRSYTLIPGFDSVLPLVQGPYIGGMASLIRKSWDAWAALPLELKAESVHSMSHNEALLDEVYPVLVESLFYGHFGISRKLVTRIEEMTHGSIDRILDVGAGSAVWSIPFAQRSHSSAITAVDLPSVVAVTKRFIQMFHVDKQYEVVDADVRQVDFSGRSFDLILLGQVLHALPKEDSQYLLSKFYNILRPGGFIVISETVQDNHKSSSSSLFRLYLYLLNMETDVFPMAVYRDWLMRAGFREELIQQTTISGTEFLIAQKH